MTSPLEGFVRSERLAGVAGELADVAQNKDVISVTNDDPRAAQSDTITVTGATNDKTYTVTIDGVAVSFTADGTATIAEIADGLAAAITAEPLVNGRLTAVSDAIDTVTLTARVGGVGYTLAESDAQLTTASVTANASADPVPFGRLILKGAASAGSNKLGVLADAAKLTAMSMQVTYGSGTVSLDFRLAGSTDVLRATGASAAALSTAVDGLAGLDSAESAGVLTISATVAGQGFELLGIDGDATVTAQPTGDDINKLALGVSLRDLSQETDAAGTTEYAAGEAMSTLRGGRMFVATEASVTPSDPVFVRLAADGSLDDLGGFAPAAGTGLVQWTGAEWSRQVESGLAVLEINL